MVLDCGCGAGTITLGLAEAVPGGHVIGVDLDLSGLKGAQRAGISLGQQNVSWIGADGRSLPFHGAIFDAVLVIPCWRRSMILLRSLRSCGG